MTRGRHCAATGARSNPRVWLTSVMVVFLLIGLAPRRADAQPTGSITGTVSDDNSSAPLAGVRVGVYDMGGRSVRTGTSNSSGLYTVTGLPSGTYYVRTLNGRYVGYIDELYQDVPCPDGDCAVTTGTGVTVVAGASVPHIDFHLTPGGGITGTVTDAATNAPLDEVRVYAYGASGRRFGSPATTNSSGRYSLIGLPTGVFYLLTSNSAGYIDELYDGMPCPKWTCNTTTGTGVSVTVGATIFGIDFGLVVGGTITGAVRRNATGTPLVNVYVLAYDASGRQVGSGAADASGTYVVRGLPTGTYYVRTSNLIGYIDELYDNMACPEGRCTVVTGTPVPATAGATTAGIDFVLALGAGAITGTVTDAATNMPLAGVSVLAYDSSGREVASAVTTASGAYTIDHESEDFPDPHKPAGLAPGTYYLRTYNSIGYLDELYNDKPCPYGNCAVPTGTAVTVTIAAPTTNINFALDLGGTITGTVTAWAGVYVYVYDAGGEFIRSGTSDSTGRYVVGGLATGTYYVYAEPPNSWGYVDELYDDIPCPNRSCATTIGTAVAVTAGATAGGIDFRLAIGATISGTVTDVGTGAPLTVTVVAYDASGREIGSASARFGSYTIIGLPAGTYYLRTFGSTYLNELYGGNLCPNSGCVVTSGTGVPVAAGARVTGIDFALAIGGTITGTITDAATHAPLADVFVLAYNASGVFEGVLYQANSSGVYTGRGLPTGRYYLRTSNSLGYVDELYDDTPCPAGTCTVTTGLAVNVVAGAVTGNVDFGLVRGGTLTGAVTDADTSAALAGVGVEAYDVNGTLIGPALSGSAGVYTLSGMPAGTYFLRTSNALGYVNERYNGDRCAADDCTLTEGSPVTVTAGTIVTNIDFALATGGTVTGTIADAATGTALAGVSVYAYDARGIRVEHGISRGGGDGGAGVYTVTGLPEGTYYLTTSNSLGYVEELYRDAPCPGGTCALAGTGVTVIAGGTTAAIDFALVPGGTITGTVTDYATSTGLAGVSVGVYDAGGESVGVGTTDPAGVYTVTGLPTGVHYARSSNTIGYVDEVYAGMPCPPSDCRATTGTPVPVTSGAVTRRVDFHLVTTAAGQAPAFTEQPASQVVTAGAAATFTVAASGTPPPTCRWEVSARAGVSWTSVGNVSACSGATAPTLIVESATVGQNGTRYRAVATNSVGSRTSLEAVLAVAGPVSVVPSSLRFAASKNGAAGELVNVTAPQTVMVTFSGAASSWSVAADQPWVHLSTASDTGDGIFSVSITNPANVLGASTSVDATVTLTSPSAPNSPRTIAVALAVDLTGGAGAHPAFGQIDTPAQGATGLAGTIAVTGWALDDIGVSGVGIYRNCLPGLDNPRSCQTVSGQNVVFVGDAVFAAGARPDVELAFPSYPNATRAGWGFLMLTNQLPHVINGNAAGGGQGALTLYAMATDVEGHVTILGRSWADSAPTSIVLDNDHLAKPFGAIDTPAQGATISGRAYPNFGWALTPDGDTTVGADDIEIPASGRTMFVFVDGVPVAPVTFNQCRGTVGNPPDEGAFCDDDVSNLFGRAVAAAPLTARLSNPTRYRNLDAGRGAIGLYVLDTTTMANGLHTIAWSATDSASRVEGIGSRFFTVLNGGSGLVIDAGESLRTAPAQSRGAASSMQALAPSTGAVWGRTGFDLAAPYESVRPAAGGVTRVRIPELSRLELWLGPLDGGWLVANESLRDLPPGSHLDRLTGQFTWAPGPGYLGTYRLVFLRAGQRLAIDVTIQPLAMTTEGESEVQLHIDAPDDGQIVKGPFTIAGWALDPQAWTGSGIGAVHVWADRRDGPASGACFLGAATLDFARPDVAEAFGLSFDRTGFSLTTTLPPGQYDVTAYAWNRRTARWEDARTVRVNVRQP